MVASGAGAAAGEGEGEMAGVGVGNFHGFEEPLGVLHGVDDVLALFGGEDAFDGAGFALKGVDALGLGGGFIDGEDEAAVHEFFVDVDGGGGEHDGDGAFDVIFLGFHSAALGVFSGAGDGEFSFGLEEFEGVTCFFCAFFFDDGEDFVFEVRFSEVVEGATRWLNQPAALRRLGTECQSFLVRPRPDLLFRKKYSKFGPWLKDTLPCDE